MGDWEDKESAQNIGYYHGKISYNKFLNPRSSMSKQRKDDMVKKDKKSEAVNTFPCVGCVSPPENIPVMGDSNRVGSNSVKGEFANESPRRFDAISEYWRHLDFRKDEDKHLWRKQYLQKSFYLVGFALYFSFFILMMVGVGLMDLGTTVIVTLLGSTVAEVIGILLVAFNWLYPNTPKDMKEVKK